MKPNLSNFYKNSQKSMPSPKRGYPVSAQVILLSDYRHKRKAISKETRKSPYFVQRNHIGKLSKQGFGLRFPSKTDKQSFWQLFSICLLVGSLLAFFFFMGQMAIK